MIKLLRVILISVAASWLAGCVHYSLVRPAPTKVAAGTLEVRPTYAWNRAPRLATEIKQEEIWTQNGLVLDAIGFIGGLKDGEAIAKQHDHTDQQVPVFRSSMTPADLVSMVESYYRIRGVSVFETVGVRPVKFVGEDGVQFDYEFIANDELRRRGRAVMAISQGKLYVMSLNAAAVHYFDAALPEFEALVASARVLNREG